MAYVSPYRLLIICLNSVVYKAVSMNDTVSLFFPLLPMIYIPLSVLAMLLPFITVHSTPIRYQYTVICILHEQSKNLFVNLYSTANIPIA